MPNIYVKKAGESAFLWSCGDILAQFITERVRTDKKSSDGGHWYNPQRTMRSAAFAATVYTPFAVTWYGNLAKWIPGMTPKDIAMKVAADQAFFGPMLCSSFFLIMPLFEGKPPSVDRWRSEIWGTVQKNWCVWGPVQIINFTLLPPQHWVLFCNLVSIPWTGFLAYRNSRHGN